MEKFNKENPYNPNAPKSKKINLSKPKFPKWAKIILISFASLICLTIIAAIIAVANETPQDKIARKQIIKEIEIKEQLQKQKEAEEERIKNLPKCTKSLALVMSRRFVEEQLKSPASAEFSEDLENVEQINDTVFKINSYVDSQNSFGAMLRSKYSCKIIHHPNDDTYTVNGLIIY